MRMERNEFQTMLDEVKMNEERGLELLGMAKQKQAVLRSKKKKKITTVIVSLLLFVVVGCGGIYAMTGDAPAEFFKKLYIPIDDEIVQTLGPEFKEPEKEYIIENWRIKVDRYWFDQKAGLLFAEISVESTDGKPLIDEDYILEETDGAIKREDYESEWYYWAACKDYYEYSSTIENADVGGGYDSGGVESATKIKSYLSLNGAEFEENAEVDSKIVVRVRIAGKKYKCEFELEHTGEWEKIKLDPSYVDGATEIIMDGKKMTIEYEDYDYVLPHDAYHLEIYMKDGTVYETGKYGGGSKIIREDGVERGGRSIIYGSFMIAVENVEKVILNGVEVPFLN